MMTNPRPVGLGTFGPIGRVIHGHGGGAPLYARN
jgi:hypothetical protein